ALAFAAFAIRSQWSALTEAASNLHPNWWGVGEASVIFLATYAVLVQSWRMLIAGWGSSLPYGAAVRIWTISNLGRYIPGKLWSIGAMGVMAQQQGVSPAAAAGSAVLGTLLQIGAGFGVIAFCGVATNSDFLAGLPPWMRWVSVAGLVAFIAGLLALPWLLPP